MPILIPSRDDVHAHTAFNRQLFDSPQPAGRKITAGFTYLQRIAKAGNFDVWFPEALKKRLEARIAAGQIIGSEHFPAQWAAVRQFELLQEAGNHKIYDLDPSLIQRATLDLSRSMRAGGIRITVATLGYYEETASGDELEILDTRLQERIANMINMLYLDAQSDEENALNDTKLATHTWDYRNDLPHIGMVLGARDLFQPTLEEEQEKKRKGKKDGSSGASAIAKKHKLAKQFFEILNTLPQSHIVHDTAIGLQLPELNGENQWNYIASPDETLAAFNRVMGDLFDKFNGLSLSRLHEHVGAYAETKASTFHMRGYGHPLRESDLQHYRNSSLALI
jgi:hypothetical protein